MPPPQINNLVELNKYLETLERRITYLENGIEIQAKEIHDLRTNVTSKANNKDVIDYLKREKRNKILVRIGIAILGCILTLSIIANIFSVTSTP